MKPHLTPPPIRLGRLVRPLSLLAAALLCCAPLGAQGLRTAQVFSSCQPRTAIEFIAPMPAEEFPNLHPASPHPESWQIVLEISLDQKGQPLTPVAEGVYLPSPGSIVPLPTDLNGDGVLGDPHPGIPGLTLQMDDTLVVNGFPLPPATNLASLIELIGSEIDHGGSQTTTCSWVLDPMRFFVADLNGDFGTNLGAAINGQADAVFARHGVDPLFTGVHSVQNPTITIYTADWISTVDSETMPGMPTPFLVCVEVRIPCFFDVATLPPTPVPLDPLFGPCWGGAMACTGTFPAFPGPGFHPMFPGLDVRFSDAYFDGASGTFVPGGVITGGQCGVIWGSTGASLAYAFRQSSVHAWYGANGVIDTGPLGGGDDQLIYRFTMPVTGRILDTDVMPGEMLVSAAIESTSNCFSITNLRVKHHPQVVTHDP